MGRLTPWFVLNRSLLACRPPGCLVGRLPPSAVVRTYRAELAPWRMRPLHPKYVDRVYAIAAQIRRQGGTRHPAYVTICPYCGTEDRLIGTIRVGAKQQVPNIPMTSTGYDVPNARGRETEILVIHCGNPECGAAIDPLAYWAPVNFYEQKEKKSLL